MVVSGLESRVAIEEMFIVVIVCEKEKCFSFGRGEALYK